MNAKRSTVEIVNQRMNVLKLRYQEMCKEQKEIKALGEPWLQRLRETTFGQYLLLNSCLDGKWVQFLTEKSNSAWFNEISALASMRLQYDVVKKCVDKFLFGRMNVGIYPAEYVGAWTFIQQECGAAVSGISDIESLVHTPSFDLIIKSGFLYGEQQEDSYPYLFSGLKPGGLLITNDWIHLGDMDKKDNSVADLIFEQLLQMGKIQSRLASQVKMQMKKIGFEILQPLNNEGEQLRSFLVKKPVPEDYSFQNKRVVAHSPRRINNRKIFDLETTST